MATRTETRLIRLAQWRKIFQQKAESGLTAKEFCAINNISRDAYFYWQNLVRQEALATAQQPALVELKPPALRNVTKQQSSNEQLYISSGLSITVNGATINVNSDTPKELLSMVLEVVSNA